MVATVGGNDIEIQSALKAVQVARQTFRCAVARSPERARTVLAAGDQASFEAAFKRFNATLVDCLDLPGGGELGLESLSLAGLVAEAWFNQSGAPKLLPQRYDQNTPKLDFISTGPASLINVRLAECLASRTPDAATAFVMAKPSTREEDLAFGAVVPLVPSCLDHNVTLRATRATLRLALAYALYRRTLPQSSEGAGE